MSLGGARIVEHRRVQRAPPPRPHTAPPPPPSTRPEPKANPGTRTDTHDRVSHRPRRPSRLHHLRVNGRPHHIGVGRTHARTRVLILVHDLNTRIFNATNGELLLLQRNVSSAVVQSVAMACCAAASGTVPSQTSSCSLDSTPSFGFGAVGDVVEGPTVVTVVVRTVVIWQL